MARIWFICIIFVFLYTSTAFGKGNNLYFFGTYKTNYVVTDPLGRRTGFDPTSNQSFNEIPNSTYIESGFGGPEEPQPDNFMELHIRDGVDGVYKIKVIGNSLGNLLVSISYPQPPNGPRLPVIQHITDINKVDYYELNYSYTAAIAGNALPLIHIAYPSTLIDDILLLAKLAEIGNQEYVNELIEKVHEIEKERTKPQEKDEHLTPAQKAIKDYKELLKEITEKYQRPEGDEFVKQEAYTVLKEDLEYIIGHVQ